MKISARRSTTASGRHWVKHFLPAALGLICLSLLHAEGVWAQSKMITLSEMVNLSGTIVSGKVIEVREGTHPDYPNIEVTFVTLYVKDSFKGAGASASKLTFMQFGGLGVSRVRELPSYAKGEEVMMFLYPESQYGFTSPIGGEQGKFRLETAADGGTRISNSIGNAGLFKDMKTSPLSLSQTEQQAVNQQRGSVDYKVFGSVVRKLISQTAR